MDWLREHGLSITMEAAKRYSLAMRGVISLRGPCESHARTIPVQRRYHSA